MMIMKELSLMFHRRSRTRKVSNVLVILYYVPYYAIEVLIVNRQVGPLKTLSLDFREIAGFSFVLCTRTAIILF